MTHTNRNRLLLCSVAIAAALTACAGFGGATIGGTLGGLSSGQSVTLQNNGTDNLTLTTNGSFSFATNIDSSKTYSVTVLTQPSGQSCTVANASGTVDSAGDDVTSVSVSCSTAYVSGTVTGLRAGTFLNVTLNNGATPVQTFQVLANGTLTDSFVFSAAAQNTTYTITVPTNPQASGQTCTVTSATAQVFTTPITNLAITCS